jgi:hypothetical protein
MFDQMTFQGSIAGHRDVVIGAAQHRFERALMAGRMKWLGASVVGRCCCLLSLSEAAANTHVTNRRYGGVRSVPLEQIRGTLNKGDDFDQDFNPLREASKNRWVKIAAMLESGESLPPVELVQLGDVYFVSDGHHRISAARALNYSDIEAEVTIWECA